MPFVRISLNATRTLQKRRAIADAVHLGMQSSIGVPAADRFQIIETLGGDMIADPSFLGIERDEGMVMIEIHLVAGRDADKKRALYRDIASRLKDVGVEKRNVFIHLVETKLDDWSFGDGLAQYADRPPAHV